MHEPDGVHVLLQLLNYQILSLQVVNGSYLPRGKYTLISYVRHHSQGLREALTSTQKIVCRHAPTSSVVPECVFFLPDSNCSGRGRVWGGAEFLF